MRKAALACVLGIGAMLVFSGCFVMRSLEWPKNKVEPHEKVKGKVTLTPGGDSLGAPKQLRGGFSDAPQYPFFYLLTPDTFDSKGGDAPQVRLADIGEFDVTGEIGGPSPMFRDYDLADVIENEDDSDCFAVVVGAAKEAGAKGEFPNEISVIRAEDEFTSNNQRRIVEAEVPARVNEGTPKSVQLFFLGNGSWFDDGDGDPEPSDSSDDEYFCGVPYTSTFIVK